MTEDLEQLSKEQIQGRIKATEKGLKVLGDALSEASEKKETTDPVIYRAIAEGYAGEIVNLQGQLKEYQGLLKK